MVENIIARFHRLLKSPLEPKGDALDWFLLVGLTALAVATWKSVVTIVSETTTDIVS